MKDSFCSFAVSALVASLVLAPTNVWAGDSNGKPTIMAAAQVSKSKQSNACRTRYRSCVKANQIPPFECQYIYTDCVNHIY
jgi:hypothetical protein